MAFKCRLCLLYQCYYTFYILHNTHNYDIHVNRIRWCFKPDILSSSQATSEADVLSGTHVFVGSVFPRSWLPSCFLWVDQLRVLWCVWQQYSLHDTGDKQTNLLTDLCCWVSGWNCSARRGVSSGRREGCAAVPVTICETKG